MTNTQIEEVYVGDLVKRVTLVALNEYQGIQTKITDDSVSRPSLELSGNFKFFKPNRIQVFGSEEQQMLTNLIDINDTQIIEQYLTTTQIPLIVFSRDFRPNNKFLMQCDENKIPVYTSPLNTTMLIAKISQSLREFFAPQVSVHGVMLEVCGVGVLIQGRSSIGKSETALELISRGKSYLIADDRVILYENEPGFIIARSPKILEHMIEIRGIGIVDVFAMYGGGAYKPTKKLSLVIELRDWDKNFKYNRLGADVEYLKFIETQIPQIILPVNSGRNVASLIEAAALNHKLKEQGINASETFVDRLTSAITDNQNSEQE